MCLPIDDPAMMHWLRQQLHVLSVWQVELLLRDAADVQAIERLEAHRVWLESELDRLEMQRSPQKRTA
ncbi:MAG: hypothetical protein ACK46Q_02805 [Hyphomonas sp.]